jgi:putative ABC transport system permease protein
MFLRRLYGRLVAIVERRRFERELDEELLFHLEMEIRKNVERGIDPVEARHTAARAFGGMARAKEDVRAVRGLAHVDSLVQDLRFAVRTLRASPGFTLVSVVTLALGIGVNTAIVSVVKEVLLSPLPYADASRVVLIDQRASTGGALSSLPFSVPELEDYRRSSRALESIVEYHSMPFTLLGDGVPERVDAGVVSASFFDVLRVRPIAGRTFLPGEDAVGAEPVLLLGYEYWQRRYRGDPAVVGRLLEMNDRSHLVVGVLPPLPRFPEPNDVFMPVSSCPFRSASAMATSFSSRMVMALGRLHPGVDQERASEELTAIAARLRRERPEAYREIETHRVSAVPLAEGITERARPALLLLVATAGFVLLIACSNFSNLHLAELSGRSGELALRAAIGADRMRILRQLLTESLLLAVLGAALGVVLARAVVGVLVALAERLTPRDLSPGLDPSALVFAFGVALAAGLGAGVLPVLLSRGSFDRVTWSRTRPALVVAQLAVSLVLLAGAGLTLRSLYQLERVETGFETERVLTMHLDLDWHRYGSRDSIRSFQKKLLAELQAMPGVSTAALGRSVPLSGREGPDPERILTEEGARAFLDGHAVSPGYFRAIGVPLVFGRTFSDADGPRSAPVAIVSEAAASRIGVGKTISWGGKRYSIVGVVGDVRQYGLEIEAEPSVYFPLAQVPLRVTDLVVRADAEPRALAEAIERAVHEIDPAQAVAFVSTLEEARRESIAAPRLLAMLLSAFAALALAITAVGLGGALALAVRRRTREIGIRLALGAAPRDVSRMVLRQGLGLLLAGLAFGLPPALALAGLLSGQLFEIEPRDPLTFGTVVLLLVLVSSAVSLVPARRAVGIDPMSTIRMEGDC